MEEKRFQILLAGCGSGLCRFPGAILEERGVSIMNRYAGVLLSVTSLPSRYGVGCFDRAAYDFVDWLEKAGQSYWQILPLGATDHGASDDYHYQDY